jgi:hypothetical protein
MASAFCTRCGSALEPGGRFCPSCGIEVWSEPSPPSTPEPDVIAARSIEEAGRPTSRSQLPMFAGLVAVLVIIGGTVVVLGQTVRSSGSPGDSVAGISTTPRSTSNPTPAQSTAQVGGVVHGPGFTLSLPAGYAVVNDGNGGSDFHASLGGEPISTTFVIVSREPFAGSLDDAIEHWQTVSWEGRTTLDLGPAKLSGVGADGEHMAFTGFPQGTIEAYLFVHNGQVWELRLSGDPSAMAQVAASFRFD